MITPVILAGGTGSRLWPLSRAMYPKQFIPLIGNETMLQATVNRLNGLPCQPAMVICNEMHRFIAAEQLRYLPEQPSIILEPASKNTAPALALAAIQARKDGKDPLLLVLAADHLITDNARFHSALQAAIPLAEQGKLVTFGIVPSNPEIGYGYVRRGETLPDGTSFTVDRFVEKPDAVTAESYVLSGEYYWNSGMFMFRASRYLEELEAYRPDIFLACCGAMENTTSDLDFIRIDPDPFNACPDDSVDYAVMEKTTDAVVVPMDAGWSDVGCWSALWDVGDKDDSGNVATGDVLLHGSSNNFVYASDRLVATVGLDNTVIIETKDAVLVARKDRVQDVKHIVENLKNNSRSEFELHREVYRPWGKYDAIDTGSRYQVKRITVKPGEKLSIQMHYHRAEHWIVVSGTAKVTNGEKELFLTENQSTYIPVGVVHALENPGKIPLEIIEVQSGPYLGEDDIVRFDDRYGRN